MNLKNYNKKVIIREIITFLQIFNITKQDIICILRVGSSILFSNYHDYDYIIILTHDIFIKGSHALLLSNGINADIKIYSLEKWNHVHISYYCVLEKYGFIEYKNKNFNKIGIHDIIHNKNAIITCLRIFNNCIVNCTNHDMPIKQEMNVKYFWICLCLIRTLEHEKYKLTDKDLKEMQLAHDKKLNIENYRQEFYIIYNEYNAC